MNQLLIFFYFIGLNAHAANLSALLKANSASSGSSLQAAGTFYDVGGIGTTTSTSTYYCKKQEVDFTGKNILYNINNGSLCNADTTKYCDEGSCLSTVQKTKMVIYSSGNVTNGDLRAHDIQVTKTARGGADQFCKESSVAYNCHDVRALVSISTTDEIRDMPGNYGTSTTLPIYVAYQNDFNNLILTANDWSDLLDGTVLQTLHTASNIPWTYSLDSGARDGTNHCYSGTWSTNTKSGATGYAHSATNFLQATSSTCNGVKEIYCLCYTNQ